MKFISNKYFKWLGHILILLLVSNIAICQNEIIDSLEIKLSKTSSKNEIVDIKNELGFLYRQSNISKSFDYAQSALETSKKINYRSGEIQSYIVLGIIYKNTGEYEKATDFFMQGLKIAEEINDQAKISSCLSNLGGIYQSQKNYTKALEYYKQSLNIEENLGNKEQKSIRLFNIGTIYEITDSLDKAYTYYYNSLLIEEELNNNEGIYFALYGISGVDIKRGNLESAFRDINRAIDLCYSMNDLAGISRCNIELGKLYKKQQKYKKAIDAFNLSIQYADSINYLSEITEAYFELSSTYKLMNDYGRAYEYLNLHMAINDSINNLEISNKILELSTKYEIEKKEQKIVFLNEQQKLQIQKNKTEKRNRLYLIISFILAIALTLSNMSKILQRAKRIIVYSIVFIFTVFAVSVIIYYLNKSDASFWLSIGDIILDVLTYISLPVFATVIIFERALLNKHLKTAQNLSEQIKELDKPDTGAQIDLFAENEKDYFEIKLNELLFIEANDNYSGIYIAHDNQIKKLLLRSSLKRMEDQLKDFDFITRCHKSYIVNIHNIKKISGNAQGYKLHFEDTDIEIPVSRSFPKSIIQKIKAKI
ncbi:MAG: hypothetical protein C0596_15295 [Marinilabiliales bacterium]|nr:MAG: hypothetical protein C0596_15295 [Marinilabiliales bacterium]